jgi:hypothetical protein
MIEGSGSGSIPVPLTSGSGSGSRRPKNTWIRWIRTRIRIRNTDFMSPSFRKQCSGYMTFWCGSGSADPCLLLMDPDPAIFVIDLQDASKKQIFYTIFLFDMYRVCTGFRSIFGKKKCLMFFSTLLGYDIGYSENPHAILKKRKALIPQVYLINP